MAPKSILVTGATGKQGGAVVDALLANYLSETLTILAVTRDPSSPSAKRLASRSPTIKLVGGNLDDVPALFASARAAVIENPAPIWGVYSVQVSLGPNASYEGEIAQGKALVDEAIKEGVVHFVYSSVERGGDAESWERPTPIPHFQTKHTIELHLRDAAEAARMGWTIIRPVAFMDNLQPGLQTRVFLAALGNWLGAGESADAAKPLQWIATHDIGVFTAMAFAEPSTWNRRAVGLAGDELTVAQLEEVFRRATGEAGGMATFWFLGSLLTLAVKEFRLMIAWFASDGYRADIAARKREHPGLLTMEEWLKTKSSFETTDERLS